jgi:UDP-glucose 4-epimerase
VPLDTRDLNYSVYFEQGEARPAALDAYTSHNTVRLDVEGVKKLLLAIPEIRQALGK